MTDESGRPGDQGGTPLEPYTPPERRRDLRGRVLLFVLMLVALVVLAYGVFGFLLPAVGGP